MFGQVPKVLWQRHAIPDRRNRITMGLNCLLVRLGDKNILVDTGVGGKETPHIKDIYGLASSKLLRDLKKADLSPKDIHAVVLSHLHFDHCGGCTKQDRFGEAFPTFPRATYYVQRSAWEEANNPNERTRAGYHLDDFVPLLEQGQLTLLDGDCEVMGGISVRVTHGHTQGHQIVLVDCGGERVAFLGDLVPTTLHVNLPYIAAFDRHPEDTLELKRQVLDQAEREGWLLIFSHGYKERAAYLERRNGHRQLRVVEP